MKLIKNKKAIIIICTIVFLLFAGGIWYFIYDFLNDYRCSTMSINDFYNDSKCEKYWRYR